MELYSKNAAKSGKRATAIVVSPGQAHRFPVSTVIGGIKLWAGGTILKIPSDKEWDCNGSQNIVRTVELVL